MTFVFDPAHIDYFFGAPDNQITFRPAVERFTQRVFGLTSKLFFPLHGKMLTELRHLLVPDASAGHTIQLGLRALELLPHYVHHAQVELYGLCRSLVFHAAVEVLFGRRFLDGLHQHLPKLRAGSGKYTPAHAYEAVEHFAAAFYGFEEGFELAASPVPHAFQPGFVRARKLLLDVLRAADAQGAFAGTPMGELLDRTSGLPPSLRPNLLLAVLWASQANTVPALMWATAFLLLPQHAVHRAAVVSELRAELGSGLDVRTAQPAASASVPRTSVVAAAVRLAGSRRSSASRCVSEAVRLRVQSIDVRIAAANLDLPYSTNKSGSSSGADGAARGASSRAGQGGSKATAISAAAGAGGRAAGGERLRLPRGRILAVCPFETHHDCGLYGEDAWQFNPDRQDLKMGEGVSVVPGVAGLAFGGGPYRCPGRFFAEQELGTLVQLLLYAAPDMQLSYPDRASRSGGHHAHHHDAQAAAAAAAAAAELLSRVPPQPQLSACHGGSLLFSILSLLIGRAALEWGMGWFDGLAGALPDWRTSGDPAGLLPLCDLRKLVGVKVPKGPCWVSMGKLHT